MENPLVSIVIPTKNRYLTLIPVIQSIINSLSGNNYEIVVHDNSDDNTVFSDYLQNNPSERINYFYTNTKLSVPENFNLAFHKTKGQYVVSIGDDDLVSPFLIEIVEYIKSKNIDAVIYDKANFFWPGLKFAKEYAFNYPASLQHPKNCSFELKKFNTQIELDSVLEKGGSFLFDLPAVYHGIVSRNVLDKIVAKYGNYFPGSSPDMASSIAITTVIDDYYKINIPASITGASKTSAAGMGVNNQHVARLNEVAWLPENILEIWDEKLPKIWTGQTIYAQSIYEVLSKANIDKNVNYQELYNELLVYNYSIKDELLEFYANQKQIEYSSKTLIPRFKLFLKRTLWKMPAFVLNLVIYFRGDFTIKVNYNNVNSPLECMNKIKGIQQQLFNK